MKIIITIADIHFGAIDPKFEYETLYRDFIKPISNIPFSIVAICGDLFDSKMMSNNPAISYAIRFVTELAELCASKNASLVLLDGTQSHDNGQLSLFYNLMHNEALDVHIVESIKFIHLQGLRILCIPERYGINEEIYKDVLYNSGGYDMCFLHGTYRGSYHGSEVSTLKSNGAPIFGMEHFINCAGPILMGHYHIAGCYDTYAYYNGSALRYKFGEEQDKGFMITAYDNISRYHYTELVPIKSHSYITINIDSIVNEDPKNIIEYIKNEKASRNIDYIRVQFNYGNDNLNIVRNYFRNSPDVKLQELKQKDIRDEQISNEILEKNQQYSYIIDKNIGDYDKFVMYINQSEGFEFITADELIKLLEEDVVL